MAPQSPQSMIFSRPPPGPKEGREAPNYRPLIPQARRRTVLVTLVIFVCICLFISHSTSTNTPIDHVVPNHPTQLPKTKPPISKPEPPQDANPQSPQRIMDGEHRIDHQVQAAQASSPQDAPWRERKDFLRRLQDMIAMYPEPARMRALLIPIDSGGKERMKDLGFRTRMYRKYFEAWERLHTAEDDTGEVFVRDNVVQYLQGHRGSGESDEQLASTIRGYETVKSFMARLGTLLFPWTSPYHASHMSLHASMKKGGRGIVLTAGSGQVHYLLTSIHSFRKLGCTLPIEVMFLGDVDLSENHRDRLEELPGVITRDLSSMVNDEGWTLRGWAAKPYAILLSSFREAIFIDADSLFFKNPEVLFEDPGYKETGALFFRDRLIMPEMKRAWLKAIFDGVVPRKARESRLWTGRSGHQQESGVIVIDKWRHFVSLLLICRFNGSDRDRRDGKMGVYEMMHGDKESFWIGFLLTGEESFSWHAGDAGAMGRVLHNRGSGPADPNSDDTEPDNTKANSEHNTADNDEMSLLPADSYTMCSSQLLHLDVDNTPLWLNGWLLDNKFAEKARQKYVSFESYLVEPRDSREPTAWQLGRSNRCCLTTDRDKKFDFTTQERALLRMITDRAREVEEAAQKS